MRAALDQVIFPTGYFDCARFALAEFILSETEGLSASGGLSLNKCGYNMPTLIPAGLP